MGVTDLVTTDAPVRRLLQMVQIWVMPEYEYVSWALIISMGKSATLNSSLRKGTFMKGASMFLTATDLHDLTGQARPASQSQWLRSKSIPFIMGGDGLIKVSKEALLLAMEKELVQPGDMPGADIARIDPWDKVEEKQMAELLGITYRALQGRRAREVIPKDVWCCVGGRIMYSLKRYDDWLESLWPAYISPNASAVPPRTARKRHSGEPIYKLV
ncbi:MAG: DUF4224 domain-containing protein [Pseudomonas sp.]|uniref:DUF4224 domain-containing protein n=1 Tax=Pseudomonas sp. TaxID=306 RepID=UPI003D6EAE5A